MGRSPSYRYPQRDPHPDFTEIGRKLARLLMPAADRLPHDDKERRTLLNEALNAAHIRVCFRGPLTVLHQMTALT